MSSISLSSSHCKAGTRAWCESASVLLSLSRSLLLLYAVRVVIYFSIISMTMISLHIGICRVLLVVSLI